MARSTRKKAAPAEEPRTQNTEAAKTAGSASPPADASKPGAAAESAPDTKTPAATNPAEGGYQSSEPGSRPDEGQGGAGEGGGGSPSPEAAVTPSGIEIVVTGPAKGRWRCGRKFTAEPQTFPLEVFTEAEQAALIGDPELTVETRRAAKTD